MENKDETNHSFDMHDAFGRFVFSNASNDRINSITMEHLRSLIYHLRISSENKQINFMVVVLN